MFLVTSLLVNVHVCVHVQCTYVHVHVFALIHFCSDYPVECACGRRSSCQVTNRGVRMRKTKKEPKNVVEEMEAGQMDIPIRYLWVEHIKTITLLLL